MKRIFPDVIEVYKQFGSSNHLDEFLEDKIYQEYVNRLPAIQEYFCRVSNKKAIEAGVMMSPLCSFTSRRNLLQAYVPKFTFIFKQALRNCLNLIRNFLYSESCGFLEVFYGCFHRVSSVT